MSANLENLKPGEILLEDYMKPMGLTQNALARAMMLTYANITSRQTHDQIDSLH